MLLLYRTLTSSQLEVNVEKTMEFVVDDECPYTTTYRREERARKAAQSPSNLSDDSRLPPV